MTPLPEQPKTSNTIDTGLKSKCGRHNPDGVRVKVAAIETTQFGEWPSMCLMLRSGFSSIDQRNSGTSTTQRFQESFLGGASLIAPGIAITAAHKIE